MDSCFFFFFFKFKHYLAAGDKNLRGRTYVTRLPEGGGMGRAKVRENSTTGCRFQINMLITVTEASSASPFCFCLSTLSHLNPKAASPRFTTSICRASYSLRTKPNSSKSWNLGLLSHRFAITLFTFLLHNHFFVLYLLGNLPEVFSFMCPWLC